MILKIVDSIVFHSKGLIIHELTNGVSILSTIEEDSDNLNRIYVTLVTGSDERLYSPLYDASGDMVGYTQTSTNN